MPGGDASGGMAGYFAGGAPYAQQFAGYSPQWAAQAYGAAAAQGGYGSQKQ
jgi:hypothetical protein